jgi:protein-tyrosine phosphatase
VWITPELALGPAFGKGGVAALRRAGVGAVIEVRSDAYDDEAALARQGIALRRLRVRDKHPPTQRQLEATTRWALKEMAAGRKVYVHCRSGLGRSPCVTNAILVAMGYPLSEAYAVVRARRPWLNLSPGQREALERFERRVMERRPPAGQA